MATLSETPDLTTSPIAVRLKRIDDPQIKALQWYLDFLSDDFEKMSDLQFSKRVIEAQHYFTEPMSDLPLAMPKKSESDSPLWPTEESFKTVQASLRSFLEDVLKNPGRIHELDRVGLVAGVERNGNIRLRYLHWDPQEVSEPERSRILAKVGFSVSLDRIPLEAIRVCKQCGRYFVHVSKKVRDFCTSKCTSRAMSKRRRDADPEKYRAVQREIVRKKYRMLKANQRGVPSEKVKIQGRSGSRHHSR